MSAERSMGHPISWLDMCRPLDISNWRHSAQTQAAARSGLAGCRCTVGGKQKFPPNRAPKKGINKEIKYFSHFFLNFFGFKNLGFGIFPGVLEGLGSSGKLVGTFSTYPGTYKRRWSPFIAKSPPGGFFLPSTVALLFFSLLSLICQI